MLAARAGLSIERSSSGLSGDRQTVTITARLVMRDSDRYLCCWGFTGQDRVARAAAGGEGDDGATCEFYGGVIFSYAFGWWS